MLDLKEEKRYKLYGRYLTMTLYYLLWTKLYDAAILAEFRKLG